MGKPARTFKVDRPIMKGNDVKTWQQVIHREFRELGIPNCPLKNDGEYGHATRSMTATLCTALGMHALEVMATGVTPELRKRIRDRSLTDGEKKRFESPKYKQFRAKLRKRWAAHGVHAPVDKILADSWGFHPGVHDGIDVLCRPDAVIFAMVKSRVIDVRSGGWWGLAPSGDVTKGDGIIQLEVLEDVGPFKKGMHIGYGHAEKARVKKGQIVKAGEPLGHAGLAVAWHVHLMLNDGSTTRGIGNRDPRKILDYAVKHG